MAALARKNIQTAVAKVAKAKDSANAAIRTAQSRCRHSTVVERPSGVTGYRYIENSWFPAVRVCADCGLVEEKERMTPLYNTYEDERKPRLKREVDYKIDAGKLMKLAVRLID